jgi:hypothetical protein
MDCKRNTSLIWLNDDVTTQIPGFGFGGVTEMVSEHKLQYSETSVLRVKSKEENDVRDHSKDYYWTSG